MTTRVQLHDGPIQDLLKSWQVQKELESVASRIAAAANSDTPGHRYSSTLGHRRALAMVWTDTDEARQANIDRNTLERAIDAGR